MTLERPDFEEGRRVVVVGGGIAGLAAAYRLQRSLPETEIVLVERDTRLGGKILTESVDGFIIEAGPDSFLSSKPAGIALCREIGVEDRLEGADPGARSTFVMRDGRLYPLPEGLSGLVPARLGPLFRSGLLSPSGKLRVLMDYVRPPRRADSDESLGSFVRRRLGNEIYERLIEPLMTGIYGGNGDELSLAATFPRLQAAEVEHGGLIRGLRASQPPTAGGDEVKPPSPFLTLIGGMGEMVEALRGGLDGVRVLSSTAAWGVERASAGYTVRLAGGDGMKASAVILAAPACAAADLIDGLDPTAAQMLRTIPYAPAATVSLAYPSDALPYPLKGRGYIVPRLEGRPVLACTWSSSKFQHRAPAGHVLIRTFLNAVHPAARDRAGLDLVELARAELKETLHISHEPLLSRTYRWPQAMPQYTVGHLDRVAAIERRVEQLPGLFFAGSAYRGVGIPDCIASGEAAAGAAAAFLRQDETATTNVGISSG